MTTPPKPAEYILGTDEAEFQRLGLQHQLWSDLAHQTWKHALIAPGQTVLDVGCGPGYATFDLAQAVGHRGRVIAVDESAAFIARLKEQASLRGLTNIEAHVADVHHLDRLGIAPGSVDLAYARWVLCFVKDPAAIVRAVARLLRHAGRFAVNDYFNYESMTLAPRRESFSRAIRAVGASWRARAGDPDVAGRLPRMFAESGLSLARLDVHLRLARPGESMWHWPDSFWKNYIPRLVESGHLTSAESDAFFRDWSIASNDAATFMELPPVYEVIGERA